MENYRHFLSGFFEHRDQAQIVFDQLVEKGLPSTRLHMFDADSPPQQHKSNEGSNEVLKDVLVDSAIGTVAGTAIGGIAEVALVAANVSLFVASPLIGPLVMLGWGAAIGGFVGATIGATSKPKTLSTLIEDAITNGQIVLVAETHSKEETELTKDIFRAAIGDYQDTNSAYKAQ